MIELDSSDKGLFKESLTNSRSNPAQNYGQRTLGWNAEKSKLITSPPV